MDKLRVELQTEALARKMSKEDKAEILEALAKIEKRIEELDRKMERSAS